LTVTKGLTLSFVEYGT